MSCLTCGKKSFGKYCFQHKPRRPMRQTTQLKGKKRIKRIGKVGRQWYATRQEWIAKNLPSNGVWNCHYCGIELHKNELTLDHKLSRSRRPELRFELSNLVPACWKCNTDKGSKSAYEYLNEVRGV